MPSTTSLSRRELAAGIAIAAISLAPEAVQGQTPVVASPVNITPDIRVSLIEQSHGKPFAPDTRKAILEGIQGYDKQWIEGRAFNVPDQTEPNFVFTPTRKGGRRG